VTKVPSSVRNVWSNVMLVLSNVTIEPSKCDKEIRGAPNVTKVQSYVMLVLHNVRTAPSKPNVRKLRSNVMLILPNVTIEPSFAKKKKNRTTKCDKSTVTCNFDTAQFEDNTNKC